jgi:acyl CoA:acetate/3-ketoacid CoA transferase beta subunit
MIVTEMAVIEVTAAGLALREIAADTTLDKVKAATGAPLIVVDQPKRFE